MTIGSFVHGALSEMTPADLERMLELDESLFVEHKGSIGEQSSYSLAKTIASFANTLGGWLLVGVRDGKPYHTGASWAGDSAPTLADAVRDRLRGEVDPLPAFEARVVHLDDGPVGVVRVYESADTPHVSVASGSVFVREGAGVSDATDSGSPGARARGERIYAATQIRSRSQLIELSQRGVEARRRVEALVEPTRQIPLIASRLGLRFRQSARHGVQPQHTHGGSIFVRLVPYTLPSRFLAWSTTAKAAEAVLSAAEELADRRGLAASWRNPHPAGVSVTVPLLSGTRHSDAAGCGLEGEARVVLDGAGIVGTALELSGPDRQERRSWTPLDTVAADLIRPVIEAAAAVLRAGEFLGRAWCQIDLVAMSVPLLIEGTANTDPAFHVPTGAALALPSDIDEVDAVARFAANALGRSAGVHAWDVSDSDG